MATNGTIEVNGAVSATNDVALTAGGDANVNAPLTADSDGDGHGEVRIQSGGDTTVGSGGEVTGSGVVVKADGDVLVKAEGIVQATSGDAEVTAGGEVSIDGAVLAEDAEGNGVGKVAITAQDGVEVGKGGRVAGGEVALKAEGEGADVLNQGTIAAHGDPSSTVTIRAEGDVRNGENGVIAGDHAVVIRVEDGFDNERGGLVQGGTTDTPPYTKGSLVDVEAGQRLENRGRIVAETVRLVNRSKKPGGGNGNSGNNGNSTQEQKFEAEPIVSPLNDALEALRWRLRTLLEGMPEANEDGEGEETVAIE